MGKFSKHLIIFFIAFNFIYNVVSISFNKTLENLLLSKQKKLLDHFTLGDDWNIGIRGITYKHVLELNIENKFEKYIGNETIFVYEAIARSEHALGNRFGNYFEALFCAEEAGLHFVCIPYHHHHQNMLSKGLPTVIQSNEPSLNRTVAVEIMKKKCEGFPYPWATSKSLLFRHIPQISSYFSHAVDYYINTTYQTVNVFLRSETFSYVKFPISTKDEVKADRDIFPLIPSAVVVFRCCDILTLASNSSGEMGFTNWNVYTKLIPSDASVIYLLSEPLDYSANKNICSESSPACKYICEQLVDFLSAFFPNAIVALRRGYPSDSMVQIASAKTVICAATTFCFFPSFARSSQSVGRLYQQGSNLICKDNRSVMKDLIGWITKPTLLYFNDYNISDPEVVKSVITILKNETVVITE